MPEYTIKIDGLPINAEAPSKEEARREIVAHIRENPGWLSDYRQAYAERASGPGERFLIGAGRGLTSAGRAVGAFGLDLAGQPAVAEQLRQRDADEAATFDALDSANGVGAEDFGELTAIIASLGTGPAARGATLLANLGKVGLGLPTKRVRQLVTNMMNGNMKKADVSGVIQQAATPRGKQAIETIAKQASPEAAEAMAVAQARAAQGFRPGANQRVRDAQVNVQRELRQPQQSPQAVQQGIQQQAQQQAAGRSSQAARQEAELARQNELMQRAFQQQGQRETSAAQAAELRELIRKANTGQQ